MKSLISLFLILVLVGCDTVTVTQIIKLETDTYISSADFTNHSALPYLKVSKGSTGEERTIVKIPTGKNRDKQDDNLEELLKNPLFVLAGGYFFITLAILNKILSCDSSNIITPDNLTSAKLIFDVTDNQEGTLSSKMNLQLLSKPWWQHATWDNAYYFSSKGRWSSKGGDTDPTFQPVTNSSSANTTIEFDITTYFKSLITAQETTHFGMLVSPMAALNGVTLASTQYSGLGQRPRVEAVYTGKCVKGSSSGVAKTYFLGSD